MRLPFSLLIALFVSVSALSPANRQYSTHNYYVLEHDPLSGTSLVDAAWALGLEVVEQAGELRNHWLLRSPKTLAPLVGRHTTDHVLDIFESLQRKAALPSLTRSTEAQHARRIVSSIKYLSPQTLRQRLKRAPPPPPPPPPPPSGMGANSSAEARLIAQQLGIVDPLFPKQWHLINDKFPEHMMNPVPVWDMGITGKGVISALVDDGLDYRSHDLADNFVRAPLVVMFLYSQKEPGRYGFL
jgi:kexin